MTRTSKNAEIESASDLAIDDVVRAVAHAPPRAPPDEPAGGDGWGKNNRYVIQRRLGRGGMGTIYLASDTLLGRFVALKVLDDAGAEGDGLRRARLLREARVAAGLEHERIARVYDVDEQDRRTFVSMEYVRGVTLRSWMTESAGPSSRAPREVLAIASEIAEGLAVLHASGIVHRDLKPENVMLRATGGVKLVDFGLAGHFEPDSQGSNGATTGAGTDGLSSAPTGGTPGYMAPERYRGERVDARADVYALGVIIHELVSGQRPNRADLDRAEGSDGCEGNEWSRFPPLLARVAARALRADRDARFPNGAEMLQALRGAETEQAGGGWDDPGLAGLAKKVSRFWLDNVSHLNDPARILPQKRTTDFSLVTGHWERNYRAMRDVRDPVAVVQQSTTKVFDDAGRVLLIVGDPGCGKTLNLLLIARYLLQAAGEPNAPVPVVFNLATWRKGASMSSWLVEELGAVYQVARRSALDWVSGNRLAVLLDGLDEVTGTARADCITALNAWIAEARPPAVVVTSRLEVCQSLPVRPALNAAVHLHPLSTEQVDAFVSTRPAPARARLVRVLESDDRLAEMARTPLLLNLVSRVCESATSDVELAASVNVPDRICGLYVGEVVGRRPDVAGDRLVKLEHHLTWVAQLIVGAHRAVFRIEDIQPQQLRTFVARLAYALASRALVAGLLALSIVWPQSATPLDNAGFRVTPSFAVHLAVAGALVTWLNYAFGAVAAWAFQGRPFAARLGGRAGALVGAMLSGAAIAILLRGYGHPAVTTMSFEYGFLASVCLGFGRPTGGRDIGMHELRTWSLSAVRAKLVGLSATVAGMTVTLWALGGVKAAEFTAAAIGLGGVALTGVRPAAVPANDSANSRVHATVANGLLAFGLVLACTTVVFAMGYGPLYGLAVASCLATVAGLRFGGVDAIYHYTLRCVLLAEQKIDFRLAGHLETAAEVGLLRRLGGGYLFVHRLLLEHYSKRSES